MKDVVISHPYKADNCIGTIVPQGPNSNEKRIKVDHAVSYVKQVVEKFWKEN